MESHKALNIFKKIFPDIKFSLKSVISDEIKTVFEYNINTNNHNNLSVLENLEYLLIYLESELKHAKKKLSKIKRLYKKGEASIQEVNDNEIYVFEIEEEIEDIKHKLNKHNTDI